MDCAECFREDNYEASHILLQSILGDLQNAIIVEIWEVIPELSQTKSHFVVLIADGSHSCTCNLLISFGVPCRHFYKVLRKSSQAKFHISLINPRWYQDSKLNITDDELASLDILSIVKDNYSEATVHRGINFDYIHQVRGGHVYTEKLQSIVSTKAKYGRSFGIARKALDLAQKLNCYNELNGMLQLFIDEKQHELLQKSQITDKENIRDDHQNDESNIICSNPVTSRRCGRPPNRYLSEGETSSQNKKQKAQRKCKGCQGVGHDLRNCKSKVLVKEINNTVSLKMLL